VRHRRIGLSLLAVVKQAHVARRRLLYPTGIGSPAYLPDVVARRGMLSLCSLCGSWALSTRPFSLCSPEMSEAAIGVLRTGRLAAFALTLIILAL